MKNQLELTSTEAAALLDVHPSTVKRWCNDGELPSDQTPGGHRRIRIGSAVSFARDRGIRTVLTPFHPFEADVWTALRSVEEERSFDALHALGLTWAREGEFQRLEELYLALGREEILPLCDFCDHAIRGLLTTVGDQWEAGKLRVGDEHMVSQSVTGALMGIRREWLDEAGGRSDEARPSAVVGTMEGNQHQIGALCVRLLLERMGWQVFFPGQDVPVEDFAQIQRVRSASLVCISLPPSGTIGDVSRTLSVLREFYDPTRPYSVVFGGTSCLGLEGNVQEAPFESVGFFPECRAFREALDDDLGRPRRSP